MIENTVGFYYVDALGHKTKITQGRWSANSGIQHTQLYTGVLEVVEEVLHGNQSILVFVQILEYSGGNSQSDSGRRNITYL